MDEDEVVSKVKSWEVTDQFWERVEPLVPEVARVAGKTYQRKAGGGRKPKSARLVFEAILYVLRTGCQWKALPTCRAIWQRQRGPYPISSMGAGRLF